jgi:hypothetical protein
LDTDISEEYTASIIGVENGDILYVSEALVILYGCKTWFPTLKDERRLKLFEIKVLGGIFVGVGLDNIS